MKKVLIYLTWAAATTGVLAAMFAPDFGLMQSGPFAAIGMALLGLAMIRQTVDQRTSRS